MEQDKKIIKKGKIIILVLGVLSLFNIILLINNKSYALFRRTVSSKRVIEIHTASKFPSKILSENIKDSITIHTTESFNPTIEDEDGTIYLSGTNNQINFNYVWYSGKLWRIIAINPDNTIKMITQDAITAINWGEDTIYKDEETGKESWIYQWLNEDFLDTLYNQENIIVQNAKWNATLDGTTGYFPTSIPNPKTLPNQTIPEGNVGLLNVYEYYQSYKNATYQNGYLNIGYYWWLITPYSSSNIRNVFSAGFLDNYEPVSHFHGIRPSINLKSDIRISGGKGTRENPYRIEGDKEIAKSNEKLNGRVSGEYVKFDNNVYRIVEIENEMTKLTSIDYVRDEGGEVLKKPFSNVDTDTSYGSATTMDINNWAGYLNVTWYNSINEIYKNMLVKGTYYLGECGGSYKDSICSASSTTETTKECGKTSSIWKGYVGLPRIGEMFSAQFGNGAALSSAMYLISPFSVSSIVSGVNYDGYVISASPSSKLNAVRPSITLNSNVYITGGKGTNEKPYEIAM